MKTNTLVVSLTVLLAASTASPATTNAPTTGELTPLQAQTDYDTLRKALEEAHAGLYRHSTETEINRRFEAHRAQLNRPMSRIDFIGIVSGMLADIRCGHTGLTLDPETQAALAKAPLFPLRLAVENRRLVVMFNDTPNDATIRPGMEIAEINGRTADAILDLLLSKLTTDGYIETGKRWRLAQNFGRNYWLFVDRSAEFTIKARDAAGGLVTAKLAGVPGANRTRNQNPLNATMLANTAKFEGAPENVALRFVEDSAIAHLRIRGFGGSDYPQSVENAFRTLAEKGAKVLILDLRGNGGGNDLYGAMLVSYLRDQPFRYFDHIDQKIPVPSFANWRPAQEERSRNNVVPNPAGGYFVTPGGHQGILEQPPGKFPFPGKVILLMDGRTFSTAADVCATLHHLKRATFVGEESGGGYCGNTSGLNARVVLPNSQLSVTIPMWGYWNAVAATADKHRGTLPDHPVETRVADLLGGTDAPWEKALQLATVLAAQENPHAVGTAPAPAVGIIEVTRPVQSAAYRDGVARTAGCDAAAVTAILEETLGQVSAPAERYQLIFTRLSFRYAQAQEWRKLLDLLRRGQAEGLFFPFQTGERPWPEYVAELGKHEGFAEFLRENDRLRSEAQKTARLEYFVEKPTGYTPEKKYPLVLVFHGGVGSLGALAENWHSHGLAAGCLVARVQGAQYRGSFSRTYENDNFAGLLTAYRQILDHYSVDPSRVILAGQSNGGRSAIQMAARGAIPAKGLILAFPTRPGDLDEPAMRRAAHQGLRAVFLCGEKDGGFSAQQEMRALFERAAVPVQYLSFPEKGHEFPDEFPAHLDRALDFIFQPAK